MISLTCFVPIVRTNRLAWFIFIFNSYSLLLKIFSFLIMILTLLFTRKKGEEKKGVAEDSLLEILKWEMGKTTIYL